MVRKLKDIASRKVPPKQLKAIVLEEEVSVSPTVSEILDEADEFKVTFNQEETRQRISTPTNVPVVPYGQPGDRAGNLDNDTKQRVEKYKYVIRYLKQKSNIKDKLIENIVAENLALRERVSVLEHVVEKLEILADTEIEKIIQDAEISLVDELSKCFCVPTKEILWEKGDLRKG